MHTNPKPGRFFADLLTRPHRFFTQYFATATQRPYYKTSVALWLLSTEGLYMVAAVFYVLDPESRHKTFKVLSYVMPVLTDWKLLIHVCWMYPALFFITNYWLLSWAVRFLAWLLGSDQSVTVVRSVRTYAGALNNIWGSICVVLAVLLKVVFPSLSLTWLIALMWVATGLSSWGWYVGMIQLLQTKKWPTRVVTLCLAFLAGILRQYSIHDIEDAYQKFNTVANLSIKDLFMN